MKNPGGSFLKNAAFWIWLFAVTDCRLLRGHPLPLPMGEVAEHSEVGEGGNKSFKKSVSPSQSPYGDSSPIGRAKGLYLFCKNQQSIKNGAS